MKCRPNTTMEKLITFKVSTPYYTPHKSGNISETRKDRGKVTMEGLYWELTNALSKGTIPDPYGLLFLKIVGSQPPSKTSVAVISGMGKATDFKFGRYIQFHRLHPNKSPLKLLEKGNVGVSRNCPNCLDTPIISGTGEAIRTSNFVRTFIRSIATKAL